MRPDRRNSSRPIIFLTLVVEKLTEPSKLFEKSTKNQVLSWPKAAIFCAVLPVKYCRWLRKRAAKARPTVFSVSDKGRLPWFLKFGTAFAFHPSERCKFDSKEKIGSNSNNFNESGESGYGRIKRHVWHYSESIRSAV